MIDVRTRAGGCACLVLAVTTISSEARAEERADPWSYPLTIDAQLSSPLVMIVSPAPYGWVGASVGYSPAPWFAIDAGGGLSYVGPRGTIGHALAIMPRVRWTFGSTAVALGTGISTGKYWWNETPLDSGGATKSWDWATWANFEASFEWRASSGFELRPYFGLALLLNPRAGICDELPEHCLTVHADDPSRPLPYFGMAIGRAFDPCNDRESAGSVPVNSQSLTVRRAQGHSSIAIFPPPPPCK